MKFNSFTNFVSFQKPIFYLFQNEEIFVQLNELDELERITHA